MGRKLENVTSPEFAEAVRRAKVTERPDRMEGDHLGFYTEFPTREGEQVLMRTAISFVSLEDNCPLRTSGAFFRNQYRPSELIDSRRNAPW